MFVRFLSVTLVVCAVLGLASAAHATIILQTGFETSQNYHAGTNPNTGHQLTEQLTTPHTWAIAPGFNLPNFDVYTYAGAQAAYNPKVPNVFPLPQPTVFVTPPQNPNGGLQFAGGGGQDGDVVTANFGLITSGLVEYSVDYFPGEWFDNNGGNYNGAIHLRNAANGNNGGIYTGRGSAQASGDANGNGPWAPQWDLFDSANNLVRPSPYRGVRYDGVPGFDNLSKAYWHRIGMVFDVATGKATQFKVQELIPGGNIYIMNNPVGPENQDLYLNRSAGIPVANVGLRLYNVGTGTLSNYDNLYAGTPYTWQQVPDPEPSLTIATWVSPSVDGTTDWHKAANWQGTPAGAMPPNAAKAQVTFGNANTKNTADLLDFVNVGPPAHGKDATVGQITFNGVVPTTIRSTGTEPVGNLILDNGAGNAALVTVNQDASPGGTGAHIDVISAPITIVGTLADPRNLEVKVGASDDQLTLSGPIGGGGGLKLVTANLGKVVLGGTGVTNDYSGGTTVEGGTLEIASAGALPAGQALTIAAGGTVVLSSGLTNAAASNAATSATAVPEPGTIALLAAGLAGLLVVAWRRRR